MENPPKPNTHTKPKQKIATNPPKKSLKPQKPNPKLSPRRI